MPATPPALRQLRRTALMLWSRLWALVQVEMPREEVGWLLTARHHLSLLESRRAAMLLSRMRLVAGLFAVLTPLWVFVDMFAFDTDVWLGLAFARIVTTLAFAGIVVAFAQARDMRSAYRGLAFCFAVPTVFFLFCQWFLGSFQFAGFAVAFSTGYVFLPFVMVASLSVFPLTLLEAACLVGPIVAAQLLAAAMGWSVLDWPTFAASLWLLLLIAAVACLAALSQLAFIVVLIRDSIRDRLTGCYSRRSAEELLRLHFARAQREDAPLALALVDLDRLKAINDRFGHEAGDRALISATHILRRHFRPSDLLARWSGEEFLLLMTETGADAAKAALERVLARGLGLRPDGSPLTASIGIAERRADRAADWGELVDEASRRMTVAKEVGRNRVVASLR